MNEEEFDAKFAGRPFTTAEAAKIEAQSRRTTELAIALWGADVAHLQRQLTAPHPEIPPEFELADYHRLLQMIEGLLTAVSNPKGRRLDLSRYSGAPFMWQARAEIVRRAIRYLESR